MYSPTSQRGEAYLLSGGFTMPWPRLRLSTAAGNQQTENDSSAERIVCFPISTLGIEPIHPSIHNHACFRGQRDPVRPAIHERASVDMQAGALGSCLRRPSRKAVNKENKPTGHNKNNTS
jgi:hypothetical protein